MKSAQKFEYPTYFNIKNLNCKFDSAAEDGIASGGQSSALKLRLNQNSSSSSNSEFMRVLNRFKSKNIKFRRNYQKPSTAAKEKVKRNKSAEKSAENNKAITELVKSKDNRKESTSESDQTPDPTTSSGVKQQNSTTNVITESSNEATSNQDDAALNAKTNPEANKTLVSKQTLDLFDDLEQNETTNNQLPSYFQDLLSKKSFQPSLLKDKGLFTHYMICKYIDDLPNSWNTEDLTNATGDLTAGTGNDSVTERPPSTGLKRPHSSDSESAESETAESGSDNVEKPTPNKVVTQTVTTTTTTKTTTNTSISQPVDENFLQKNTVIDYLFNREKNKNKRQSSLANPVAAPVKEADDSNQTANEMVSYSKKPYSHSSKSHSKIVLIDENDDDLDEDEQLKSSVRNDEASATAAMTKSQPLVATQTSKANSSNDAVKIGLEPSNVNLTTTVITQNFQFLNLFFFSNHQI